MTTNTFFLALISETATQASVAPAGSLQEQTLRSLYRAIDAGDSDRALTYLAAECRIELPFAPEPLGHAAYGETLKLVALAFPDMRHDVVSLVEEGSRVTIQGLFSGTNSGPFNGMPASNRRVSQAYTSTVDFNADGLIRNLVVRFDLPAFLAALQPA